MNTPPRFRNDNRANAILAISLLIVVVVVVALLAFLVGPPGFGSSSDGGIDDRDIETFEEAIENGLIETENLFNETEFTFSPISTDADRPSTISFDAMDAQMAEYGYTEEQRVRVQQNIDQILATQGDTGSIQAVEVNDEPETTGQLGRAGTTAPLELDFDELESTLPTGLPDIEGDKVTFVHGIEQPRDLVIGMATRTLELETDPDATFNDVNTTVAQIGDVTVEAYRSATATENSDEPPEITYRIQNGGFEVTGQERMEDFQVNFEHQEINGVDATDFLGLSEGDVDQLFAHGEDIDIAFEQEGPDWLKPTVMFSFLSVEGSHPVFGTLGFVDERFDAKGDAVATGTFDVVYADSETTTTEQLNVNAEYSRFGVIDPPWNDTTPPEEQITDIELVVETEDADLLDDGDGAGVTPTSTESLDERVWLPHYSLSDEHTYTIGVVGERVTGELVDFTNDSLIDFAVDGNDWGAENITTERIDYEVENQTVERKEAVPLQLADEVEIQAFVNATEDTLNETIAVKDPYVEAQLMAGEEPIDFGFTEGVPINGEISPSFELTPRNTTYDPREVPIEDLETFEMATSGGVEELFTSEFDSLSNTDQDVIRAAVEGVQTLNASQRSGFDSQSASERAAILGFEDGNASTVATFFTELDDWEGVTLDSITDYTSDEIASYAMLVGDEQFDADGDTLSTMVVNLQETITEFDENDNEIDPATLIDLDADTIELVTDLIWADDGFWEPDQEQLDSTENLLEDFDGIVDMAINITDINDANDLSEVNSSDWAWAILFYYAEDENEDVGSEFPAMEQLLEHPDNGGVDGFESGEFDELTRTEQEQFLFVTETGAGGGGGYTDETARAELFDVFESDQSFGSDDLHGIADVVLGDGWDDSSGDIAFDIESLPRDTPLSLSGTYDGYNFTTYQASDDLTLVDVIEDVEIEIDYPEYVKDWMENTRLGWGEFGVETEYPLIVGGETPLETTVTYSDGSTETNPSFITYNATGPGPFVHDDGTLSGEETYNPEDFATFDDQSHTITAQTATGGYQDEDGNIQQSGPIVIEAQIGNASIGGTTETGAIEVTDADVTARDAMWDTYHNPTISISHTTPSPLNIAPTYSIEFTRAVDPIPFDREWEETTTIGDWIGTSTDFDEMDVEDISGITEFSPWEIEHDKDWDNMADHERHEYTVEGVDLFDEVGVDLSYAGVEQYHDAEGDIRFWCPWWVCGDDDGGSGAGERNILASPIKIDASSGSGDGVPALKQASRSNNYNAIVTPINDVLQTTQSISHTIEDGDTARVYVWDNYNAATSSTPHELATGDVSWRVESQCTGNLGPCLETPLAVIDFVDTQNTATISSSAGTGHNVTATHAGGETYRFDLDEDADVEYATGHITVSGNNGGEEQMTVTVEAPDEEDDDDPGN